MSYEYVKEWRRRNKERAIEGFGGKCGHCGLVDHPDVYDFHHLDPSSKEFHLSQGIRSWNVAKEELAKCALLCAVCHRKYHAGVIELSPGITRFEEVQHTKPEMRCQTCTRLMGHRTKANRFCSPECASIDKQRVDWDELDVNGLLRQHGSYSAVSRLLGVSDNTVKKRYLASIGSIWIETTYDYDPVTGEVTVQSKSWEIE